MNELHAITRTHNAYHLGDNLVHLNFLRRVALANPDRKFIHYAQWNYLAQLREAVADLTNIELADFNYLTPADSIDSWRGAQGFWYSHPNRNDFVGFHIEWFEKMSRRMHIENPIKSAQDMLFDYPNILQSLNGAFPIPFDILCVNSPPGSGQFAGYDQYALADLASMLATKGHRIVATHKLPEHIKNVPTTAAKGISVTGIGHLSLHCHTILMVSTGPSWPTFNIWNRESIKHRIILIDSERVELSPNSFHCRSVEEAKEVLRQSGLL